MALSRVAAVGSTMPHGVRPTTSGGLVKPSARTAAEARPSRAVADRLETALANHVFAGFSSVQNAFKRRDKIGQGTVSHAEFREALQQLGVFMDEKQFRAFCHLYDRNNSGRISYDDFNRNMMAAVIHRGGIGGVKGGTGSGGTRIGGAKFMPRYNRHSGAGSGVEMRVAGRAMATANGIANAFRDFDVDRSGGISLEEFHTGLKRYGVHLTKKQAKVLASKYDTDGDGQISLREFTTRMNQLMKQLQVKPVPVRRAPVQVRRQVIEPGKKIRVYPIQHMSADEVAERLAAKLFAKFRSVVDAFRMFDHDHSGSVTYEEFRESLTHLGFHMRDAEFKKFVEQYDATGSGHINYVQFNNKVGEIIHPSETGALMFGTKHGPTSATLASWVEAKFAKVGLVVLQCVCTTRAHMVVCLREQAIMVGCRDAEEAFDRLDTDGSGSLSAAEFVHAVREFGLKLSYEEGADLVEKYDPANGGKITREMFKKRINYMMNQSSSACVELRSSQEAVPHNVCCQTAAPRGQVHEMQKAPIMSKAEVEAKLSETMFSKFTKVQQAFRAFDRSHSGSITHKEFREAMRSIGFELTDADFREFVATYDKDNDGSISYAEFNKQVGSLLHPSESGQLVVRQSFKYDPVGKRNRERRAGAAKVEAMFAQQSVARLQKAQDMFRRFDTDNSGTISHSEFIKALDAFGIQLGFQESKELLMSFDTNQDGLVSLQEFTEHFTNYLQKFVKPTQSTDDERQQAINEVIRFQRAKVEEMTPLQRVKAFKRAQAQSKVLRRDWGRGANGSPSGKATSTAGSVASRSQSRNAPVAMSPIRAPGAPAPGFSSSRSLRVSRSSGRVGSRSRLVHEAPRAAATTFVQNSPAEVESRLASGMAGSRWNAVLRKLRQADAMRSGVVPVVVLEQAFRQSGVQTSGSDVSVLATRYTAGRNKVNYSDLMQKLYEARPSARPGTSASTFMRSSTFNMAPSRFASARPSSGAAASRTRQTLGPSSGVAAPSGSLRAAVMSDVRCCCGAVC